MEACSVVSMTSLTLRSRVAIAAGTSASWASRRLGRGSGGMIGGKVALKLAPNLLADLAAHRRSAVVSGTNGKSTTTRLLRAALFAIGEVASNTNGDNMTPGITTALMRSHAPLAALEVDEMHMPVVSRFVNPQAIVLLNLSRDQLDRVGEIGAVERRLRKAVNEHPDSIVIANCDDPLIASAAWDSPNVQWVAAGHAWMGDSTAFPRGGRVIHSDDSWRVVPLTSVSGEEGLEKYQRPEPMWWLEDEDLSDAAHPAAVACRKDGLRIPLRLSLPGRANLSNALEALAAAVAMGVDPQAACRAMSQVEEVAGRYSTYEIHGRLARLMLAKNPAGWQEAMYMIDPAVDQVIVAVNGQVADGQDLSWLWDVDFSVLGAPARKVYACGERGADLAVRLEYAGVHCELFPLPMEALRACTPGRVEILLNYTALRDFKRVLDSQREAEEAE